MRYGRDTVSDAMGRCCPRSDPEKLCTEIRSCRLQKKVPQHWRIASSNDTLSSIMAYLNIDFGCGKNVRRTGNAAEAYIFCMLESAHGGDTAAAENLFFLAMYAMFLAYDPWLNLT